MNVPRKKANTLRFAYRFSSQAQKATLSHLFKEEHLEKLVNDAEEAIMILVASKKQSKKFFVELLDKREKEDARGTDKKKSKGKGKAHGKKAGLVHICSFVHAH